jgi:predicted small lipoprotein YifL
MKTICKRKSAAVLALSVLLMLCLALAGCGQKQTPKAPEAEASNVDKAKAVVEAGLGALKKGDMKTAQKYIPDLDPSVLENDEDASNKMVIALLKEALHNMDYKVLDAKETEEDEAEVKVEVSNLDMAVLIEEYLSDMMDALLADEYNENEDESEEMIQKRLDQIADRLKEEKKLKTDTIEVEVDVEDGTMEMDEDQLDKMLGGLLTAEEKMNEG